jgi:iron complex outermembrane recepter protein
VGYVYSSSKLANTEFNNLNNLKLAAALDSSVVNGQAVCNVSITNPGLYPGCTPINVFGPGSETAAQLAYVLDTTHFTAYTKQHDISGAITGSPFATGAGDVRVALSGEYRHQTYRSTSDAETVAVGTAGCVGLIAANCVASTTQGWFQTFPNRTPISQSVTEAAVEVNVPVLANSAIGDSLDLSGAVRWTHYNTTGTYWTWKVGLDWKLSSDVRFRGTVSRDIRAPTLDDLFAATSCFPANTTDLLTGLNSTATDCTVANPNLTSEIGKTLTAGVVVKPSFIPGLSMSLDYYNITIDNAITTVVGTNQTIQAACYSSNGTSPYCALQDRALGSFTNTAAANFVTNWRRTVFNIAKIKTAGFDFETNYRTKLMGHPFALRALVTYQPHVRFFQPGIPVVLDMGGIAYGQNGTQASPKWRITAFLNFEPVDNLTINLMHRWRSSLGITADPSQFTTGPSTPGYGTTNINLGYKIPVSTGSAEVFFSVQNLFDNIGPPANFGGGQANIGLFGGFPIGDDPVGRRFTAGVKFKF